MRQVRESRAMLVYTKLCKMASCVLQHTRPACTHQQGISLLHNIGSANHPIAFHVGSSLITAVPSSWQVQARCVYCQHPKANQTSLTVAQKALSERNLSTSVQSLPLMCFATLLQAAQRHLELFARQKRITPLLQPPALGALHLPTRVVKPCRRCRAICSRAVDEEWSRGCRGSKGARGFNTPCV